MAEQLNWHETIKTDADFAALVERNMTLDDVRREYCQPEWCREPEALGPMGCWSLWFRMVTGRDYCKTCECSADYIETEARGAAGGG